MADPNVLLVVLDSVRARNTSLHGYGNDTTPFLRNFSEEASVYTQARAPGIHSVASHASIFSGLHVEEHTVTDHASSLAPEATIWHELSENHGYETGIFSPNTILTVTSNLAAPFDRYEGPRRDDRDRYFEDALAPTDIEGRLERMEYLRACIESGKPIRSAFNGLFFLYNDRGDYDPGTEGVKEYVDSFLEWSANTEGPWAACLNVMDAHLPYVPMDEYNLWGSDKLLDLQDGLSSPQSEEFAKTGDWWKLRAIESLYDCCIRQCDAGVEYLVEQLRRRGDLEDTLLVITSDHGEGFGEWSILNPDVRMADHSWGIDETLTHVPLIVHHPSRERPTEEPRLASLTEFYDVVLEEVTGEGGSFVVDDGFALTSTRRLEDPSMVLSDDCPNRDVYAGPWRAVYTEESDRILKHATHAGETVSLVIRDAQTAYLDGEPDGELVEERYTALEDAGVNTSDKASKVIDDDVEDQLAELGYLR